MVTYGKVFFRHRLAQRLTPDDECELCYRIQGTENDKCKAAVYSLIDSSDRRVSRNALRLLATYAYHDDFWISGKRRDLIKRIMTEEDSGQRRLMLSVLYAIFWDGRVTDSHFFNYCLDCIQDPHEPPANQALCIKLAYEQCYDTPEICRELRLLLEHMARQPLSAAAEAARRNTLKAIVRHKR